MLPALSESRPAACQRFHFAVTSNSHKSESFGSSDCSRAKRFSICCLFQRRQLLPSLFVFFFLHFTSFSVRLEHKTIPYFGIFYINLNKFLRHEWNCFRRSSGCRALWIALNSSRPHPT